MARYDSPDGIEDDNYDPDDVQPDDDDRAGRDEEETPDLLVMMGISENPMKDKLTELFQFFNPKNNQI